MRATRHIGESLIDGNPLNERGEIADDLDRGIAQSMVLFEMAAHKSELRTECARTPSRHATLDAESFGFVRSCKHDSATDGDRFSAQ
jgi:hypothetical protein